MMSNKDINDEDLLVRMDMKAGMCEFEEYLPTTNNDKSNGLPPHWLNNDTT